MTVPLHLQRTVVRYTAEDTDAPPIAGLPCLKRTGDFCLAAYNVVVANTVMGRIEEYPSQYPALAQHFRWTAKAGGQRAWWFSKEGAVAYVLRESAGAIAALVVENDLP